MICSCSLAGSRIVSKNEFILVSSGHNSFRPKLLQTSRDAYGQNVDRLSGTCAPRKVVFLGILKCNQAWQIVQRIVTLYISGQVVNGVCITSEKQIQLFVHLLFGTDRQSGHIPSIFRMIPVRCVCKRSFDICIHVYKDQLSPYIIFKLVRSTSLL